MRRGALLESQPDLGCLLSLSQRELVERSGVVSNVAVRAYAQSVPEPLGSLLVVLIVLLS